MSLARNVSSDVRNYYAHRMKAMSIRTLMQHIYPPLLALHDLSDDIALPDGSGKVEMPSIMRNSHVCMEGHGVYLIGGSYHSSLVIQHSFACLDNEEMMIFWIGTSASPQLLLDLFGTDDVMSMDPHMV